MNVVWLGETVFTQGKGDVYSHDIPLLKILPQNDQLSIRVVGLALAGLVAIFLN